MPQDKHWKTVKMGSSDEGCGLSVPCWGKKVVGNVLGYIMGDGYNPSHNETLFEKMGSKLQSHDIVLSKNV